jgi:hypothetical protein
MGGLLRDDSRPTLFDLDGLACPRGGGRLRVIATVQDPLAVQAPGPAAAPLRPFLDRTPVAVQHDSGPRAIAMPTPAFAPVRRTVPVSRPGIQRGRLRPHAGTTPLCRRLLGGAASESSRLRHVDGAEWARQGRGDRRRMSFVLPILRHQQGSRGGEGAGRFPALARDRRGAQGQGLRDVNRRRGRRHHRRSRCVRTVVSGSADDLRAARMSIAPSVGARARSRPPSSVCLPRYNTLMVSTRPPQLTRAPESGRVPAALRDPTARPEPIRREWSDDRGRRAAGEHRRRLVGAFRRVRKPLDDFQPDALVQHDVASGPGSTR